MQSWVTGNVAQNMPFSLLLCLTYLSLPVGSRRGFCSFHASASKSWAFCSADCTRLARCALGISVQTLLLLCSCSTQGTNGWPEAAAKPPLVRCGTARQCQCGASPQLRAVSAAGVLLRERAERPCRRDGGFAAYPSHLFISRLFWHP